MASFETISNNASALPYRGASKKTSIPLVSPTSNTPSSSDGEKRIMRDESNEGRTDSMRTTSDPMLTSSITALVVAKDGTARDSSSTSKPQCLLSPSSTQNIN